MNKTPNSPKAAIELAQQEGSTEISSGVYLVSQECILADQEAWDEDPAAKVDFHSAPFWLYTNDGVLVPVHGEDDEVFNDLIG